MLPTGLSAPSSVEVRHRYLPGSKLIEVGGDWYESIALPGGRVAPGGRRRGRARCAGGRHDGPAADRHPHPGHARAAAGRDTAAAERAHAGTRRARAALRDLRVRGLRRGRRHLRGRLGRSPAAAAGPARMAPTSCWTCCRRRRSASGTGPDSEPRPATSRTAACWCSIPMAWWRSAAGTSTRASGACGTSSGPARRSSRWRTCAGRPWPASTATSIATTSRCWSPGCAGYPADNVVELDAASGAHLGQAGPDR